MHYVKISGALPNSSIWIKESSDTRVVWITMLAIANWEGEVKMKPLGLAKEANVSKEACEKALAIFCSPDPDSASPNDDGRRIKEIDGGWWIINHSKYREMASTEARRKYKREHEAGRRAKKKREGGHSMSDIANASDEEIEQMKRDAEALGRSSGLIQDEPAS
jgi:hypothetical protein